MDLAVPAILILLLFLPGVFFRQFYVLAPYPPKSVIDQVAEALLPGLLIQAIAVGVVDHFTIYRVDFIKLGVLLVGAKDDKIAAEAFANLRQYLSPIIAYNVGLCFVAAALGTAFRRMVARANLDIVFPQLRFSTEWAYLLSGREWGRPGKDFDFMRVDVIVAIASASVLYSGILQGVHFNPDSSPESVVLTGAVKWMTPTAPAPVAIPGQALIIKWKEILNININLFRLTP